MPKLFEQLPPPNHNLIGHRGAAGAAPENTLASFQKAAALGLNWVEFDIQLCASGEWVVFHDETLDRTTNGHGKILELTYDVIKTLDAGSWFDIQFKNERVPLLSETLACLADLNVHPNIEIKPFCKNKTQNLQNLLLQLQTNWPKTLPPPLISSFDLEILTILRTLNPSLPLGYLVDHISEKVFTKIKQNRINSLHCHHNAHQGFNFQSIQPMEIPLLVYTVNELHHIQFLLQSGVTAVFSDMTQSLPSLNH